jgi:hypothetical protein
VKIGKTKHLKSRLSGINVGCRLNPHKYVAVAPTLHRHRDEQRAHEFFASVRGEGEFFRLTDDEVREYFQKVITKQYQEDLEAAKNEPITSLDRLEMKQLTKKIQSHQIRCTERNRRRFMAIREDIMLDDENIRQGIVFGADISQLSIAGAYQNLCLLRSNCRNLDDFLNKLKFGTVKPVSGFFFSADYVLQSNQLASDIFFAFTGSRCPFNFNSIFQSVLEKNLNCTNSSSLLCQEKMQALYTMYRNWIKLEPETHTPPTLMDRKSELHFHQAITMLNQVLKRMYAIQLTRSGKVIGKRKSNPDYEYVILDIGYFQEPGEDLQKPLLPAWSPTESVDPRMTIDFILNH